MNEMHSDNSTPGRRGRAAIVHELGPALIEANSAKTFQEALHILAHETRIMIQTHQCAISYLPAGDFQSAIHTHSFSEKYSKYNTYDVMPTGEGIWRMVVKHKAPILMTHDELVSHPCWKNFSGLKDNRGLEHPPMRGWLAAPVLSQKKVFLGVLQLSDKCEGDFTKRDEELLIHLSTMIAPTFELQFVNNEEAEQLSRAKRAAETAKRYLEELNQINQSLLACRTVDEVAKTVTDALTQEFGAYFARLWLKRPGDICAECALAAQCPTQQECLHLIASSGQYRRIDGDHRRIPLGAFKIGLIAEGGGITISNNVADDRRVHDRAWAAEHKLQSFAGFPLTHDGQAIGVVAMFSQHPCSNDLLEVLELLSHSASSTIANVQQRVALEQAGRAKSEFLANMSHEIRTPLHGVLSFARFGKDKALTADPEKLLDYFEKIDTSGQRLLVLLSDILDLAKMESGSMRYEFKPADLRTVLRSVQNEFHSLLADRNITIDYDEPGAELRLTMDENRMAQVIRNLLSNAAKFSHDGAAISIDVNEDDDGVHVFIRDHGMGIPEEELETIFDKFVQSSKTCSSAGGTGLGLSICREIVEAHQGRIWCENHPEGGAVFHVVLPWTMRGDPSKERTEPRGVRKTEETTEQALAIGIS